MTDQACDISDMVLHFRDDFLCEVISGSFTDEKASTRHNGCSFQLCWWTVEARCAALAYCRAAFGYNLSVIRTLPKLRPMSLTQRPKPFDHPDWIFEIKYDGFRALAYIEDGECKLISRKSHVYKSFRQLRDEFPACIKAENAIIDGEIVCLSEDGRPQFSELLYRRGEPYFCAFDLLWLNGEDLRALPLHERKRRLRKLIPRSKRSRVLFSDHIEVNGREVFRAACRMDLEGIVAKLKDGEYVADGRSTWIKIKNPQYTQAEGRRELFEQMRS